MEPRGALGVWDPGEDRYTLYADVQYPHRVRNALATNIFKIPEHQIRVIAGDVGRRLRHQGLAVPRAPPRAVGRAQGAPAGQVGVRAPRGHPRRRARARQRHRGRAGARRRRALPRPSACSTLANVGAYVSSDRNLLATFSNVVTLVGVYAFPAAHVAGAERADQHQLHRAVSRRGPPRGDLRDRAADRRRRPRARARPGRAAPEEPDPALGDAVQDAARRHATTAATSRKNMDDALEHRRRRRLRRRAARPRGARGKLRGIGRRQPHRAGGRAPARVRRDPLLAERAAPPCSWAARTRARATRPRSSRSCTSGSASIPPRCAYIDGDTDRVGLRHGHHGLALDGDRRHRAVDGGRQGHRQGPEDRRAAARGGRGATSTFADGRFAVVGHRPGRHAQRGRARGVPAAAAAARRRAGPLRDGHLRRRKQATWPNGCHVCEVEIDPDTGDVDARRAT